MSVSTGADVQSRNIDPIVSINRKLNKLVKHIKRVRIKDVVKKRR